MNLFTNHTSGDVEEELRFHLDMLQLKYGLQGLGAADAKAAALRRFGNLERVKKQCVEISSRNSFRRRLLKITTVAIALTGLVIHTSTADYKVARIGSMLIVIAVAARLLLYVRGLSPWTFVTSTKPAPLSVNIDTPEKSQDNVA